MDDESFIEPEEIENEVGKHAFDINAVPEPVNDLMDADVGGYDDGIDFGGGDDPMDGGGTLMTESGITDRSKMPAPQMEVVHLKEHLATAPLEYSYFDNKCMSAWAGPGHWKFKPLLKSKLPFFCKKNSWTS